MKQPRQENTAITLPPSLLKDAKKKATSIHGERGFSRYVKNLIELDLADFKKAAAK